MKKPRLFYYEETLEAWAPVPELLDSIIDVDNLMGNGDEVEIRFKRLGMKDAEFEEIPLSD